MNPLILYFVVRSSLRSRAFCRHSYNRGAAEARSQPHQSGSPADPLFAAAVTLVGGRPIGQLKALNQRSIDAGPLRSCSSRITHNPTRREV